MTTLLERSDPRASVSPSQWLRETTAAVRVSFTWFGVRKALTTEQRNQAAESFGAEGNYLSARKKLLDTNHPAYKEVTGIRGKVVAYWRSLTLPFPEPGYRLIRQHKVEAFNQEMVNFRDELGSAVGRLDRRYPELQSAAQQRLGNLWNPNDYPPSLRGLFELYWEFPNVEPPDYLMHLNPALYDQERSRVAGRFDEAVRLAEQAFIGEFAELVEHLTERLADNGEGGRKVFRNTAITNLTEFFDRFRQLTVRSNEQLDSLVADAQRIIQGHEPKEVRDSDSLRQSIASQFSRVQAQLDGMLVDRPRRRLIRNEEPQS